MSCGEGCGGLEERCLSAIGGEAAEATLNGVEWQQGQV